MAINRKFVTKCTLTFKAFDFDVTMSERKSTLWNFIAFNPNNQKRYAVFCTSKVTKVKGLIKVALKKLPADHRLVVVVEGHTDDEVAQSDEQGFCLVSLSTLVEYGQEMLEIRGRSDGEKKDDGSDAEVEAELSKIQEPADFVDKVIHKDKLF